MTGTFSGERIPKDHLVTEVVGNLDEANSFLGLARASVDEEKTKRIILQVQKHLLVMGGEVSRFRKSRTPKGTITDSEVSWLEDLIEVLEKALSLPPGFVVFGQQRTASQLDVARTSIRKAERSVARMLREGIIDNNNVLKYLNRLSDLVFLLAGLDEKKADEQKKVLNTLDGSMSLNSKRVALFLGSVLVALLVSVVFLFVYHGPSATDSNVSAVQHMKAMEHISGMEDVQN